MGKRMKLEDLKIQSFVTNSKKIKGKGDTDWSWCECVTHDCETRWTLCDGQCSGECFTDECGQWTQEGDGHHYCNYTYDPIPC